MAHLACFGIQFGSLFKIKIPWGNYYTLPFGDDYFLVWMKVGKTTLPILHTVVAALWYIMIIHAFRASTEYRLGFIFRIALMVLTDKIYTILNSSIPPDLSATVVSSIFKLIILPSLTSVALFQLVIEKLCAYLGFMWGRVVLIFKTPAFSVRMNWLPDSLHPSFLPSCIYWSLTAFHMPRNMQSKYSPCKICPLGAHSLGKIRCPSTSRMTKDPDSHWRVQNACLPSEVINSTMFTLKGFQFGQ